MVAMSNEKIGKRITEARTKAGLSGKEPFGGLCEHLAHGMPRLLLRCSRSGRLIVLGNSLQLLNHEGFCPPWRGPLPGLPILEGSPWDPQGIGDTLLTEPGGLPGLFNGGHLYHRLFKSD